MPTGYHQTFPKINNSLGTHRHHTTKCHTRSKINPDIKETRKEKRKKNWAIKFPLINAFSCHDKKVRIHPPVSTSTLKQQCRAFVLRQGVLNSLRNELPCSISIHPMYLHYTLMPNYLRLLHITPAQLNASPSPTSQFNTPNMPPDGTESKHQEHTTHHVSKTYSTPKQKRPQHILLWCSYGYSGIRCQTKTRTKTKTKPKTRKQGTTKRTKRQPPTVAMIPIVTSSPTLQCPTARLCTFAVCVKANVANHADDTIF